MHSPSPKERHTSNNRRGWERFLSGLLYLSSLLGMLLPIFASAQGGAAQEFIFTSAPFTSCHASTLVELKNGDLLAAWFGGSAEGANDVAIWAARRSRNVWTAPFVLVRESNIPTWNPVLFHTHDGRLWLYYRFGPNERAWTGARIHSDDGGKTWSAPEHLPAGLLGPIKDKPLVLENGNVISGSSVESYGSWAAWIERSVDNARTWTTAGPITVPLSPEKSAIAQKESTTGGEAVYGIIQPTIVQLDQGHLRFYARSTQNIGRICVADSRDEGRTWSDARPIDLPNPNSGIDAVKLKDGRVVLAFNNTVSGRTPLNLAVSRDGEHFHVFLALENSPGEYSYPAIIQAKNGDLYITYTWNRKRIRFAHVPSTAIPEK